MLTRLHSSGCSSCTTRTAVLSYTGMKKRMTNCKHCAKRGSESTSCAVDLLVPQNTDWLRILKGLLHPLTSINQSPGCLLIFAGESGVADQQAPRAPYFSTPFHSPLAEPKEPIGPTGRRNQRCWRMTNGTQQPTLFQSLALPPYILRHSTSPLKLEQRAARHT